MLVTASKVSRFRKLADDLDAALARGDEMGMDLLKSMLPELCEAVEEINEAIREADALLFEGLRDEALGLHDPDLPAVAIRLHLEDKPQWPVAALFFETEGITPPPAIDFNALGNLNAAYSELERLRKPLDRLRRLALERAALTKKISLLRQLRKHDSAKPVWGDQLSAHEEVRALELDDAVKRAFAARDADSVAALHEELTAAEWSVPISQRLKRDTQGGSVWVQLRQGVSRLEILTAQLQGDFDARKDSDVDLMDRIERLRSHRQSWLSLESHCRESLFALPQNPAVAALASPEDFGARIEDFRQRVSPALEWLSDIDQREHLIYTFRQTCNELDLQTEKPPARKEEAKWLARIDQLESDLQRLCQQLPDLQIPESLPLKAARAVADLQRRSRRRARNRVVAAVAGLVLMTLMLGAAGYGLNRQRAHREACAYVEGLLTPARKGEYAVRPELLDTFAGHYGDDATFGRILEEFDKLAASEKSRRTAFEDLLREHDEKLTQAGRELDERAEQQPTRLEEWPPSVFDAADKYRSARLKGGFPKRRTAESSSSSNKSIEEADLPPAVRQRLDEEETRLAEQAEKQSRVERAYVTAATNEFIRQLGEIENATPAVDAPNAAITAKDLLRKIDALVEAAKRPRSGSVESSSRVPFPTITTATPLRTRLVRIQNGAP